MACLFTNLLVPFETEILICLQFKRLLLLAWVGVLTHKCERKALQKRRASEQPEHWFGQGRSKSFRVLEAWSLGCEEGGLRHDWEGLWGDPAKEPWHLAITLMEAEALLGHSQLKGSLGVFLSPPTWLLV